MMGTRKVGNRRATTRTAKHASAHPTKPKRTVVRDDDFSDIRKANEETFVAVWKNEKDDVWDKY